MGVGRSGFIIVRSINSPLTWLFWNGGHFCRMLSDTYSIQMVIFAGAVWHFLCWSPLLLSSESAGKCAGKVVTLASQLNRERLPIVVLEFRSWGHSYLGLDTHLIWKLFLFCLVLLYCYLPSSSVNESLAVFPADSIAECPLPNVHCKCIATFCAICTYLQFRVCISRVAK